MSFGRGTPKWHGVVDMDHANRQWQLATDLDNVSRTREYGNLGLCQLWKQLRDGPNEFPIYQNGIANGKIFENLGQLKFHQKLQSP